MRRIVGLLGGSFNPAHEGHLHISQAALRSLKLDEVWWLVSPQNPLKSTKGMADFDSRVACAERLLAHEPRIHVSRFEQENRTQYTIDTILLLRKKYPHYRFIWLMGADNLAQFHRWCQWEEIIKNLAVAVFDRAPFSYSSHASCAAIRYRSKRLAGREAARLRSAPLPAWAYLFIPRHSQSATAIRKRLGTDVIFGHNGDCEEIHK